MQQEVSTEAVDVDRLRAALSTVADRQWWSLPSKYGQNGVHHGRAVITMVSHGRWEDFAEPFRFVLERFAPVHSAYLSWLAPGGFIASHRDEGPYLERWQVPIHAAGRFDDDRPVDGMPFRVFHWQRHAVWNMTDRPRIHLVIDRDIPVDVPSQPYERFPDPDEFRSLIAAAAASD
ncbi:MAG TPA: hypothetical protein VIQ30_21975 [Pseudonocardia sp.]